jgi:acetate---CoA ligase (ADP-forming) subunit beta
MGEQKRAADLIKGAKSQNRNLLEHEVLELLSEYHLPHPPFRFIPKGGSVSATDIGGIDFPVVLKVVSSRIVHKSEVGGVILNLHNLGEVQQAIVNMENGISDKMPGVDIDGWLLCSLISKGTELIAGSITDAQLGAAVMAGIGGIFTEAYKDVSFRLVPLSKWDALEMLHELKGQVILDGMRGEDPLNRDALADFFVAFSRFIHENPEIEECDLNPIICTGKSIMIADARIKLKES